MVADWSASNPESVTNRGAATRFERARDIYREQVLNAIRDLVKPHAFSAVTLACCSIDLLSHTLYEPTNESRRKSFEKTVRNRLIGYAGDGVPEAIYELRSGLVHEFQTKVMTAITGDRDAPPTRVNGVLVVSVRHFCDAVCNAFEHLFATADQHRQGAFIERAYIHVMGLPAQDERQRSNWRGAPVDNVDLGTPAASGTVPFLPPMNPDDFPWK